MSRARQSKTIAIIALLVILLVGSSVWLPGHLASRRDESAIACVREWARLAPLPATARDVQIVTKGGMFSRTFWVTFRDQKSVIEEWLRASPGTRHITLKNPQPKARHFKLDPGGGAQRAEIDVDPGGERVSIYVCWS